MSKKCSIPFIVVTTCSLDVIALAVMQAASERPAFQQTLPQADKMIAAWVVCLGEFKGHVKQ